MNKTDDKFCPDCGHHLYTSSTMPHGWYYCADCSTNIPARDVATLEQAQPLRVGYDAIARKKQDERRALGGCADCLTRKAGTGV